MRNSRAAFRWAVLPDIGPKGSGLALGFASFPLQEDRVQGYPGSHAHVQ
jgi:hypothetical protein